jgi:hypothetical protein
MGAVGESVINQGRMAVSSGSSCYGGLVNWEAIRARSNSLLFAFLPSMHRVKERKTRR